MTVSAIQINPKQGAQSIPQIVCCGPLLAEGWRWIADQIDDRPRRWHFFNYQPRNWLERLSKYHTISVVRASWEAVQAVRQHRADLLVTLDPRLSYWCAVFVRLLNVSVDHVAFYFNFPELPTGLKQRSRQWAFASISHFTVYSSVEKELYSRQFGIPLERLHRLHWGTAKPAIAPPEPLESGDYIVATGRNARDYETLMAAMQQLPDIPLLLIVDPRNLEGLELPTNVKPLLSMPYDNTMNVLKYSRFMVLPLRDAEVPCGHITMVLAMHLGKPFIVTESQGVRDYAIDGENAVVCAPRDPVALAAAIRSLWEDQERCDRLSQAGQAFAECYCSGQVEPDHFRQLLQQRGL